MDDRTILSRIRDLVAEERTLRARHLGDGLEERFRGACDGRNLGITGFQAEAREAQAPEYYAKQVRDWCATSLIPVFTSLPGPLTAPKIVNAPVPLAAVSAIVPPGPSTSFG